MSVSNSHGRGTNGNIKTIEFQKPLQNDENVYHGTGSLQQALVLFMVPKYETMEQLVVSNFWLLF